MIGAVFTSVAGIKRFPNRSPKIRRNPRTRPTGKSQEKDRFRGEGDWLPLAGTLVVFLRSSRDMDGLMRLV